jgi:hypothetical protein
MVWGPERGVPCGNAQCAPRGTPAMGVDCGHQRSSSCAAGAHSFFDATCSKGAGGEQVAGDPVSPNAAWCTEVS